MQKLILGLLVVFATGFALTAAALGSDQDCLYYDQLDNCVPDTAAESLQQAFIGLAITCAVATLFTLLYLRTSGSAGAPKEPGLLD